MRAMRVLKWARLLLITASVLLYLVILVSASWEFRERKIVLAVETEQPLTEAQAVDLSGKALQRVGEDVTQFRPRPYDGTNLYARNTLAPSNGYVLWASTGSHPGFSVHLEQVGRDVHCGVVKCK